MPQQRVGHHIVTHLEHWRARHVHSQWLAAICQIRRLMRVHSEIPWNREPGLADGMPATVIPCACKAATKFVAALALYGC